MSQKSGEADAAKAGRLRPREVWLQSPASVLAGPFYASTLYYRKKEQPFNDALSIRIREIALHRIHYGFRRVHATLRREDWVAGIDRVKRLYRLEGLNLRPKQRKRRRSDVQRDIAMVALGPNECGAWTSCTID